MSKKKKTEDVGHDQENPTDPIFVPNLEAIEKLAKKMAEESLSPDRLEYGDIRETICGTTDDSQPVEQYDGSLGVPRSFVDAHESPVGVLRWHTNLGSIYTNPGNVAGARWCTGTLISDNLFLTAGHCFDQTGGGWQRPRVNGTSNIISSEEIATRMNVEFNFQVNAAGVQQSPVTVQVEELLEYRIDGLDFAIVRLAGTPGQQFGVTKLASDDGNVGDMVCIIGHPAGQPKRIEAGPITAFDDHRVRYNDIDTLGGNSGSGILRAADGCIVGIHTNGGCNAAMTGSNFGLRISRLRGASPIVQGLAAHTNTVRDRLTNPLRDIVRTSPALDRLTSVLRDRLTTNPIRDQLRTNPTFDRFTNFIADRRGTLTFLDRGSDPVGDVKSAGLDKQFSDRIPDRLPGGFRGGFGGLFGREAGAQPFVMATPHHAAGPMGGLAQEDAELEAIVAHYQGLAETAEAIAAEMAEIEAMLSEFDGFDEFDLYDE